MELVTTRKFIEPKLRMGIRPSIEQLERRIRITQVPPDPAVRSNPHTMLALFKYREQVYQWAQEATDEQIVTKLRELSETLTPDENSCKYGDCSFLSDEAYKTIVTIEDLEIALGIHPGCGPVSYPGKVN